MGFIFTIIGLMVSLDILWWIVLARLSNHGLGRILISIFMLAMMVGLIGLIVARMSRGDWDRSVPKFAVSAIFIWHFIGLGLLTLIGIAAIPIWIGQKLSRPSPKVEHSLEANSWSRRDFLRLGAAMAPPLFTFGLTGIAMSQLNQVRGVKEKGSYLHFQRFA